jgi:hypothetical protein
MPLYPSDPSSRPAASKTNGSHVRYNLFHFYVADPSQTTTCGEIHEIKTQLRRTFDMPSGGPLVPPPALLSS